MSIQTHADDLRDLAAKADRAAADSFERSDTDGFVSQAASGIMAAKYRAQADLEEAGGLMEYRVPFLLDGTIASTHLAYGQYGAYWVLNDDAAKVIGKRFLNESNANDAKRRYNANYKKGVTFGTIRVKGYVTLSGGSGTGTSGMCNVRPVTLPVTDDLRYGRYTVVATDNYNFVPESYDARSF